MTDTEVGGEFGESSVGVCQAAQMKPERMEPKRMEPERTALERTALERKQEEILAKLHACQKRIEEMGQLKTEVARHFQEFCEDRVAHAAKVAKMQESDSVAKSNYLSLCALHAAVTPTDFPRPPQPFPPLPLTPQPFPPLPYALHPS